MSSSSIDSNDDFEMVDVEEEQVDEEIEEVEFYEIIQRLSEIISMIIQVLKEVIIDNNGERIEHPLARRPITSRGYNYIQNVLAEDSDNFRQVYRMYPNVFLKLCHIIREKTLLKDTRYITVEEMVATFLLTVGQNSRYCHTRETFYRSHFATSKNFNKVLKALNTIAPEMMVKPSFTVPTRIRESTRFYPYFKDCVGAIDGTHIPAMVTGRDVSSYRNRHGIISQNVLAACNFDLEFIYVLSGWEGSAHDSNLLSDSLSRRNGLKVPQGKYFLVDCGFPNRQQFLAPYRGVRYHLQDFFGQGRDPENDVELFNLRHSSLRNVIERIFGIFKSRFTIFKSAPPFPYKTQAELVLACAGLHNFLRKECRRDEFPIELNDDESPSPLPTNDVDNFEHLFETQEQQREHANEWRAKIALDMWRDTQQGENNSNQR
ncbi:PREDICTED: uncharacterized protein LOC109154905 [Ipomoea nil]|uniref:uncharacterized protein LOC109154905 n=1 Tax=Ipomoea nil TaxID=35883 RepID=UPI0009012C57|nr:PREDICTED: uncharacterized protein LOC109154905 [Ipomoea nil]